MLSIILYVGTSFTIAIYYKTFVKLNA